MKKSMVRIEWLAFVVAAMCSAPGHSWAATINASSCSQANVQTAVNSASNGDTVTVPAGTCTWSGEVAITNKTITLQGAGSGAGGTKIVYGGTGHTLLSINPGSKTGKMDISGFWMQGGDTNYWGAAHISLSGPVGWKNLRIHHIVFEGNANWIIRGSAAIYGLIDHCTFKGRAYGIELQGRGDTDWSTPLVLGTSDFFFIEDNTFDWNDFYGNTGVPSTDFVNGGRIVFRNNNLQYGFFETHDKARSGLPSANAFEIYNNTFWTNTAKWKGIDVASGTGVIWGNTFTGSYTAPIGGMDYKKTQASVYGNLRPCDGTDPADQNISGQNGYRCQYQLGSQGQGPTTVGYAVYIWSNTVTGASGSTGMVITDGASNLQSGRDYINNGSTPKPGYAPYTYPHPLQSGGTTPPPPGDATAPTVSITAPANGATVSGSSVSVTVTASDNVGITSVAFRVDGTTLFTDTASPYSMSWNTTSASEGSHALTAVASDAAGNTTTSSAVTVTVDNVPASDTSAPSTPSNLSATAISSSQINLSWTASTDNVGVTGYRVERCTGSSCTNFTEVAAPIGTTYNHTGLAASTAYRYQVRATDAAGNLSPYSSIASATTQAASSGPAPLPEGSNGIAASYPGDANIQSNANVIFADGFESYTSANQLTTNWNSYYQPGNTRIATEAGNMFAGSRAVEFTLPQTGSEVANALVKNVSPTQDTLFVRVYTKFESGFDVVSPGHNGIRISSQYPGPGQAPNGTNFFLFELENSTYYNETEPGYTHIYTYHPEQRSQWGDHWYPGGKVLPFDATPGNFGPSFIPRPNLIPVRNQWYSYELMVKANTPGQRDGRVASWIDGNLVADFHNVRVRDVSNLKIDQMQLELHAPSSTSRPNKKWYDNVVVARSYIGPMSSGTPPPLQAPGNLRIVP